jgi:polyisoprenoid-binding protein YceI
MSRGSIRIAIAIVLLAAVAGGGYGLWYVFFSKAGPPPVSLQSTAPTVGASADPVATAVAGGPAPTGLEGAWTVDPSGSFVGYRVQEQLASIGGNTAVGRTSSVTGSLTLEGTAITSVEMTADLTTLKSDDNRRDGQLARQGIQTSQFPTATFTLSQPIGLGTMPAEGQTVSATATGDLTLHGTTRSVQIPVQAQLSGGVVTVVGSIDIVFADYGIEPPSSFAVLSIDDHGIMEFQLVFRHA